MQDRSPEDPEEIQHIVSEHDRSGDYELLDEAFPFALKEIKGARETQEDFVTVGLYSPRYAEVSPADWEAAIQSCIDDFHHPTTDMFTVKEIAWLLPNIRKMGSCFIANIVSGAVIHTANLGDSTAFVVEFDDDDDVSITSLNKLHNPDEAEEKENVFEFFIQHGGVVKRKRMGGQLAISRAIGDTDILKLYEKAHEIEFTTRRFDEAKEVFLITGCDGLTEKKRNGHPVLSYAHIALIVSTFRLHPLDVIAEKLVLAACYNFSGNRAVKQALLAGQPLDGFSVREGTEDNVSVVVTKLIPHDPGVKCIAVLDGHSGSGISEFVAERFVTMLGKKLEPILDAIAVKKITRTPTR